VQFCPGSADGELGRHSKSKTVHAEIMHIVD